MASVPTPTESRRRGARTGALLHRPRMAVRTVAGTGVFSVAPGRSWRVAGRTTASRRPPGRHDPCPYIAKYGGPGDVPDSAGAGESGVPTVLLGALRRRAWPGSPRGRRTGAQRSGRPVIFVSNHSSWVDVPVVGAVLPASFVAKGEIEGWPVVRTVARLGRTVFVSRQRGSIVRESATRCRWFWLAATT